MNIETAFVLLSLSTLSVSENTQFCYTAKDCSSLAEANQINIFCCNGRCQNECTVTVGFQVDVINSLDIVSDIADHPVEKNVSKLETDGQDEENNVTDNYLELESPEYLDYEEIQVGDYGWDWTDKYFEIYEDNWLDYYLNYYENNEGYDWPDMYLYEEGSYGDFDYFWQYYDYLEYDYQRRQLEKENDEGEVGEDSEDEWNLRWNSFNSFYVLLFAGTLVFLVYLTCKKPLYNRIKGEGLVVDGPNNPLGNLSVIIEENNERSDENDEKMAQKMSNTI